MKDIIIGRESGVPKDQARLALLSGEEFFFYGTKGSVPPSVSRRHCKIIFCNDATMDIDNISSSNLLFINGKEYLHRSGVTMADILELGPEKYRVNLEEIFNKVPALKPAYPIRNLNEVYQNYQREKMELQIWQGKLNALSALPGVLSMTSIGLAVFIPNARFVMIMVAVIFAIAFALIRYKNASKIPMKTKAIEDNFREKYICPNPKCHRFLGMTPYKELILNGSCPYCKSKYKE